MVPEYPLPTMSFLIGLVFLFSFASTELLLSKTAATSLLFGTLAPPGPPESQDQFAVSCQNLSLPSSVATQYL